MVLLELILYFAAHFVGSLVLPLIFLFAYKLGDSTNLRGFFCDDQSLMHPKLDPEIPTILCGAIWTLIGLLVLFSVEGYLYMATTAPGSNNLQAKVINASKVVGGFASGAISNFFLTEIIKYKVGRPRPHFLEACQPLECQDQEISSRFITNFTCLGDPEIFLEATKSFPSGHASTSFFVATFLFLYIESRLGCYRNKSKNGGKNRRSSRNQVLVPQGFFVVNALVPYVQLLLFTMALYISISRIVDYYHHPGDVIAGGILGLVLAHVASKRVLADFETSLGKKGPSCPVTPTSPTADTELPSFLMDDLVSRKKPKKPTKTGQNNLQKSQPEARLGEFSNPRHIKNNQKLAFIT